MADPGGKVITDPDGKLFWYDPSLRIPFEIPDKLTPEGERLRDQMVEQIAAALVRFKEKRHG